MRGMNRNNLNTLLLNYYYIYINALYYYIIMSLIVVVMLSLFSFVSRMPPRHARNRLKTKRLHFVYYDVGFHWWTKNWIKKNTVAHKVLCPRRYNKCLILYFIYVRTTKTFRYTIFGIIVVAANICYEFICFSN